MEALRMKLIVVVHPAEEGGYWAEIPALPGCISEGDTFDETLLNIREAAEGWLLVADDSAENDADAQLAEIDL
jgi:predicted RNase H-like HicB family nuclease